MNCSLIYINYLLFKLICSQNTHGKCLVLSEIINLILFTYLLDIICRCRTKQRGMGVAVVSSGAMKGKRFSDQRRGRMREKIGIVSLLFY